MSCLSHMNMRWSTVNYIFAVNKNRSCEKRCEHTFTVNKTLLKAVNTPAPNENTPSPPYILPQIFAPLSQIPWYYLSYLLYANTQANINVF